MVSFFRRKKPQPGPEQRLSIEELAAAFPSPEAGAPESRALEQSVPGGPAPVPSDDAAADPVQHPLRDIALTDGAAGTTIAPMVAAETDRPAVAVRSLEMHAHSRHEPQSLPAPAAPGKPGWRERMRGSGFARGISGLFSRNPKLDDDLLDAIETALLTADVGVAATTSLVDGLRQRMDRREFADANALLAGLRNELVAMLRPVAQPLRIDSTARPFVILTVGVNGVGKTTTIGKLAHRLRGEGQSLMLAAGDTFRAAAVAQLQAWGERNGVAVIAQSQNAVGKGGDAASVAFDALQAARSRGIDVLIADTAGRLHTQDGLMAELGKIRRVIAKLDAAAPHEVLMVIDGTTGQNALSQLRQFHAVVGVTGLVVTKLDGTAKGGVVFALAREFGIPIRFAGIGERPEDLRVFDAEAFVDALLPESLAA